MGTKIAIKIQTLTSFGGIYWFISFLYHAFGLYTMECTRVEYKGKTLILNVRYRERKKSCPLCGSHKW